MNMTIRLAEWSVYADSRWHASACGRIGLGTTPLDAAADLLSQLDRLGPAWLLVRP